MPSAGIRPALEGLIKRPQDRPELTVIDPDDDGAALVRPTRLRPAPRDWWEILDVEGDHHPAFVRGEGEEVLVDPAVQPALLVRGPDVVTPLSQRFGYPAARQVGIEHQPHGYGTARTSMNGYS